MANGPPIGYIQLPAVAAIGWIPFFFRLADVPPNAYKDTRPKAYDFLFDSGNWDPADNLMNEAGFWKIIREDHDYRGALFLADLKIHRSATGFTHYNQGEFRHLELVGYTPLRHVVKEDGTQKKKPWPCWPERRGIGGSHSNQNNPKIDVTSDRVTITHRVDFRLCRLLGIRGGVMTLTFRDAPYAWMAITLTINADGSYQLQFTGSAVPSQKLYVDWQTPANIRGRPSKCTYDMLTASFGEMEGFFRAGRLAGIFQTRRAPERLSFPVVHAGRLW